MASMSTLDHGSVYNPRVAPSSATNRTPNSISVDIAGYGCVVICERRDSLPLLGNTSTDGAIDHMADIGGPKEDFSLHTLPPLDDDINKRSHLRPHTITAELGQADLRSYSRKNYSRGKPPRAQSSPIKNHIDQPLPQIVTDNDAGTHVVKKRLNHKRTGSSITPSNKSLVFRAGVSTDAGDGELQRQSNRRRATKARSYSESSLNRSLPHSEAEAGPCIFKQGDWVSTRHGADSHGPWREMGDGKVIGPSKRKGWLDVEFKPEDTFSIKARNLVKSEAPVLGFRQKCENPMGNFAADERVRFADSHGCGVIVGPGPAPGMLFVKIEGLGVRSVDMKKCLKYEASTKATRKQEDEDAQLLSLNEFTKNVQKKATWLKMMMAEDQAEMCEMVETISKADGPFIGRHVVAKKKPWKSLAWALYRTLIISDALQGYSSM